MTIHQGEAGGITRPSKRPVTAADKSNIRTFLCVSFCHTNSASTAEAVLTASTNAACQPKYQIPAITQGTSAIRQVIEFTGDGTRLDVLLSHDGTLSRSRAAELVRCGAVTVNGKTETRLPSRWDAASVCGRYCRQW